LGPSLAGGVYLETQRGVLALDQGQVRVALEDLGTARADCPRPAGRHGHPDEFEGARRVRGHRCRHALRRNERCTGTTSHRAPQCYVGAGGDLRIDIVARHHAQAGAVGTHDKHVPLICAAVDKVVGTDEDEHLAIRLPVQVAHVLGFYEMGQQQLGLLTLVAHGDIRAAVAQDAHIGQLLTTFGRLDGQRGRGRRPGYRGGGRAHRGGSPRRGGRGLSRQGGGQFGGHLGLQWPIVRRRLRRARTATSHHREANSEGKGS